MTPDVRQVLAGEKKYAVVRSDALAFLRSLPDDAVNLIVGSPSYEDARLYLEDGEDLGIARGTEEWVAWMVEMTREAVRVCTGLVAWVVEGRTNDY